jgi:hypothetical protein
VPYEFADAQLTLRALGRGVAMMLFTSRHIVQNFHSSCPGLVPGIHVFLNEESEAWMAGQARP